MAGPRARGAEHSRKKLVDAATRRFARHGQAGVEVLAVARDARLTTGALYHHFKNRQALLHAVLDETAGRVAEGARAAMERVTDPWQKLRAGLNAVLDACLEPAVRMTYNEAPSVLGLEGWRQLEEAKSGALLLDVLLQLDARGELERTSLPLAATMLKGAIVEAAMWITRAEHPKRARTEAGALLERMVSALLQ